MTFHDGVAFIGETSLLDIAKSMALPCMYMTGSILEIILTNLRMLLVRSRTLDMQQKRLSVKR